MPKLSVLQHGYFSQAKTAIERAQTLCRDWLVSRMKLSLSRRKGCADTPKCVGSLPNRDGDERNAKSLRSSTRPWVEGFGVLASQWLIEDHF